MHIFLSLLFVTIMVVALVDIIRRDDAQVRYLPKTMWLIIVILLPFIGTLLWFTLGRVYPEDGPRMPRPAPRAQPTSAASPTRTPARTPAQPPAPAPTRSGDTRSTEQQLADLEREIEEDRLRAELARRRSDRESAPAAENVPEAL